jgi:hypothetical protein
MVSNVGDALQVEEYNGCMTPVSMFYHEHDEDTGTEDSRLWGERARMGTSENTCRRQRHLSYFPKPRSLSIEWSPREPKLPDDVSTV